MLPKKILLKEEPKRVLKRPYNLGDNCKLTGIESQGNEDIYYYSLKKKRKVKLECEGRNIVKIYEERPCGASTSRGNEDDEPDVVEVHNSRRQKGIGKKSKKTCQPNQRCEPSTSRGNEQMNLLYKYLLSILQQCKSNENLSFDSRLTNDYSAIYI